MTGRLPKLLFVVRSAPQSLRRRSAHHFHLDRRSSRCEKFALPAAFLRLRLLQDRSVPTSREVAVFEFLSVAVAAAARDCLRTRLAGANFRVVAVRIHHHHHKTSTTIHRTTWGFRRQHWHH